MPAKERHVEELESKIEKPEFWDNAEESQKVMKELKSLKEFLEHVEGLKLLYEDVGMLIEMAEEEGDEAMIPDVRKELRKFEREFEAFRIQTLLSGEYDKNDAIVTLHAGAGGTDSCDWVNMMYRMYTRYAQEKGFKISVLDYQAGDITGLKGITFEVTGENAYGYFQSEKGVHRLVRISPFNSAGKRQTSFASCDVIPSIEEDVDIEINEEDLKIDTYRASGHGGQYINRTDSAVRIVHEPSGIVVTCQDEKSQLKNKEKAMRVLRSRLYDKMQQESDAAQSADRRAQVGTGDRSELIRTYNFNEGRVSDHRIGKTIYAIDAFVDGDMDEILDELIFTDQQEKLKKLSR